MLTETPTPLEGDRETAVDRAPRNLLARISRLERGIGAVIAAVMLLLVAIEPEILEAPFENSNTILFTVGGTVLAAVAFALMLWFRVPVLLRVVVLVVPFVAVNWWLLSPYFVDDVVDETFATSIAAQLDADDAATETPAEDAATPPTGPAGEAGEAVDAVDAPVEPAAPVEPSGPVLLGAGQFVGLTGHDGGGDAGIFENPDGSFTIRFENFETDNGPDLEVYLVPGADQRDLAPGSIHLGELRGNIGNQNYELPAGTELPPGDYTVLVWCEAFSVEFTAATVSV